MGAVIDSCDPPWDRGRGGNSAVADHHHEPRRSPWSPASSASISVSPRPTPPVWSTAPGGVICKCRARPTVESLSALEQSVRAGVPPETRISRLMEPTARAQAARRCLVHLAGPSRLSRVVGVVVGPTQVFGPSRQGQLHGCADVGQNPFHRPEGIDPLRARRRAGCFAPSTGPGQQPLARLGHTPHARIRELARQMMPSVDEAMTSELLLADMVVLERYADQGSSRSCCHRAWRG